MSSLFAGLAQTLAAPSPATVPQSEDGGLTKNRQQNSRQRALHGVAWTTVGSVAAQGGAFLTSVLLGRLLGAQIFGKFVLIHGTAIALSSLASLGLEVTVAKYISEYRNHKPDKAGRILGLATIVALVTAVCLSVGLLLFGKTFFPDTSLVVELRLSALYVFFITLTGYQVGALAGLEAFRKAAQIKIVYGPAIVMFTWGLASAWGLRGAVLAQGISALFLWSQYQAALIQACRTSLISIRYRRIWQEHSSLLRFAVPATVSGILGTVGIWWCNLHLSQVHGYAELALFSATSNLRTVVLFFPSVIVRVTAPILNNLRGTGGLAAYRRTFLETAIFSGTIALAISALLAVAGSSILRLFGKDFVSSKMLILLVLACGVFEVIGNNLYQAIFASNSLWKQVGINAIWTSILVLGSIWAVPRYGATGLAEAYLAAWCVSTVLYGKTAWSSKNNLPHTTISYPESLPDLEVSTHR